MHIRRIEFERLPAPHAGPSEAWLPLALMVLLLAALAVAMVVPGTPAEPAPFPG